MSKKLSTSVGHIRGAGWSNVNRLCTRCGHRELNHWGKDCHLQINAKLPSAKACGCTGFTARPLSREEAAILPSRPPAFEPAPDEFSEFCEDLAKRLDRW